MRHYDCIKNINFQLLICDEGHRLKNNQNRISQLLSQLDINRRIILTGTPVQNNLQEFFTLIDFVNPGILGHYLGNVHLMTGAFPGRRGLKGHLKKKNWPCQKYGRIS